MALNNCFNSPRCTSMTEHLGGIGSPAEALSLFPEAFVISLALTNYRIYKEHMLEVPSSPGSPSIRGSGG